MPVLRSSKQATLTQARTSLLSAALPVPASECAPAVPLPAEGGHVVKRHARAQHQHALVAQRRERLAHAQVRLRAHGRRVKPG